jgi:type II secretory pathway component GspD/PulD (secretin)
MIESEKRCSTSRCCLGVLLILGLTTPLFAGEAAAEVANRPSHTPEITAPHDPDSAVVKLPPPPEAPTRRSYNFQDIDIRQVLSALAQDQEINLILPPEVTGKITVHLHQLTLEEAIRGITMAGGFAFTKQDDSYFVYKPKDVRDPQSDMGIIRAPVAGSPDGSTKLVYNFRDLDIRQALSSMAREQNINVIIAPEVTGKVTVHLNNINGEEAIRAVTMAGGFAYMKQDGLYYVYKPKVVLDPLTERLQIRAFRLKFAAIDKVQEILTAIPGMRTVRLHESSKTIIVEDTPENIAKIETLLQSWDVAPRQVLIEARIMQVTLTDDMSLGVEWQKVFSNLTIGTTGFVAGGAGLTGKLLTAAGTSDQFAAAIQALQTKTQVNTLSTPKILALHGKPSRVQVGGRQGYKTNTFTPTGTTENISFLDTGTILDITPYIDDKDNILLDVKPQINSVTFDTAGNPNQKTTTVSTSMLAKDGQTVFIGGLIEDTKTGTRNAVPCLGEIPGIALLFGQLREGIGKSELIVLITPQIIDLEARSAKTAEAVEKANKLDDALGKEPLPITKRLLEDYP